MDSLPLGLVLCDESGGVIFRNSQAEALMTSRYGDAIAAQAVTDVLAEGWSNGIAERTVDIYGPPRRTLTIRAAVIDDGRRPLGVLAIIEDVSERRRLEDIRRDFIANVSHELKTPMGALGLLAETLLFETRSRRSPTGSPSGSTTRRSASIASSRTCSTSRASRAKVHRPASRFPSCLIVADAIERIRTAAEQHDVKIDFVEPEANLVVVGDRRQLISAIHALLENARRVLAARRHSSASPIDRIEATVSDDGESVGGPFALIAIKDQGVGIPAKDLGADLRTFLPGRSRSRPRDRRHWPRAQHRSSRRPKSRRQRPRRVP